MSTVYSYRRDIYGKVGIQGENKLQQLRDPRLRSCGGSKQNTAVPPPPLTAKTPGKR